MHSICHQVDISILARPQLPIISAMSHHEMNSIWVIHLVSVSSLQPKLELGTTIVAFLQPKLELGTTMVAFLQPKLELGTTIVAFPK
jgi:hypothetical protein